MQYIILCQPILWSIKCFHQIISSFSAFSLCQRGRLIQLNQLSLSLLCSFWLIILNTSSSSSQHYRFSWRSFQYICIMKLIIIFILPILLLINTLTTPSTNTAHLLERDETWATFHLPSSSSDGVLLLLLHLLINKLATHTDANTVHLLERDETWATFHLPSSSSDGVLLLLLLLINKLATYTSPTRYTFSNVMKPERHFFYSHHLSDVWGLLLL
jgi:hypothetical protein